MSSAASGAARRCRGHRRQRGRPDVERAAGRGGPELLRQEPAVRDQRGGVGAAHGVEDLVHRRGEQVELVDQDHQRGLAPVDRAVVGELRAAAAGSRRPPRAGSRSRSPSPSRPAGCRRRGWRAAGSCRARRRSTRRTREATGAGTAPAATIASTRSSAASRSSLVGTVRQRRAASRARRSPRPKRRSRNHARHGPTIPCRCSSEPGSGRAAEVERAVRHALVVLRRRGRGSRGTWPPRSPGCRSSRPSCPGPATLKVSIASIVA